MKKSTTYLSILKVAGLLTMIEGLSMIPCVVISVHYDELKVASAVFTISVTLIAVGFSVTSFFKTGRFTIHLNHGYLIASLSWIYCSLLGALPFYFSCMGYDLMSCIFESVAGFTTTGCTVFDLNTMPKGLILWRAISNWLGGMGILVLVNAVLPGLGIVGQSLASTETTGPAMEKVGGRFSFTGNVLYSIYTIFTILEFVFLAMSPLSYFDALVNAFSSISTGGLLVTASNSATFSTVYVRVVIMIFTVLSSMNYTLYYISITERRNAFLSNYECRTFLKIILGATFIIATDLVLQGHYSSFFQAVKDSASQVISFISTSGYYVCDYSKWPAFSTSILIGLLFCGGCTMSTSGSLKVIRIAVMFKLIKRGIFKQIHPKAVQAIKIDGKAVPSERVSGITTHLILYFAVLLFSTLVLSTNNLDLETTFTTVLGIFTNTGMSLGIPGSSGYFGIYNGFSKFYMSFLMLAGRLEMYSIIILFTRSFWRNDSPNKI